MTELQIGLIGLGAVSVVGVVAYNTWQEYRHRKLAEEALKTQHADVLLDEENPPILDSGAPADAYSELEAHEHVDLPPVFAHGVEEPLAVLVAPPTDERIEPVLSIDHDSQVALQEPSQGARLARRQAPDVSELPPEPLPEVEPEAAVKVTPVEDRLIKDVPEPHHLLSPVIDYIVAFEAVEPSSSAHLLELQRDILTRIRKPIHWVGYNERLREWEPIIDDGESEYRSVRVGLQLVDRRGGVSDADLSIFHVAMQDISHDLMAIAELPPRQPALDASAKLDEFCAGVDIQIGINVISKDQVFPGTKLRALAEAAGMVIDADGRFVRCDEEGNVLYLLLNQETAGFSPESMRNLTTHGVTFLLDVPTVGHGERVFNQMVDLAKRFADVLHGVVVDDNRRPLSEAGLLPIRQQVGQFQAAMAANGLPAGGSLTRRLFS